MRVIDLSATIYAGMPVYPGDPEVKVEVIHTYENNNWELRQLTLGSHTGTHADAFSHMHKGAATIEQMPIERFFGPAQVVSINHPWPHNKGLFFVEEIGMKWFERLQITRPGFVGGNVTEELERVLLGTGIVTYTNLVNLELIPLGTDFMFYGFPLKIKDGDGSPVRAVAVLDS
jgi:arylformamidase